MWKDAITVNGSITSRRSLTEKEKANWTHLFIALCFLIGCNITSCLNSSYCDFLAIADGNLKPWVKISFPPYIFCRIFFSATSRVTKTKRNLSDAQKVMLFQSPLVFSSFRLNALEFKGSTQFPLQIFLSS